MTRLFVSLVTACCLLVAGGARADELRVKRDAQSQIEKAASPIATATSAKRDGIRFGRALAPYVVFDVAPPAERARTATTLTWFLAHTSARDEAPTPTARGPPA